MLFLATRLQGSLKKSDTTPKLFCYLSCTCVKVFAKDRTSNSSTALAHGLSLSPLSNTCVKVHSYLHVVFLLFTIIACSLNRILPGCIHLQCRVRKKTVAFMILILFPISEFTQSILVVTSKAPLPMGQIRWYYNLFMMGLSHVMIQLLHWKSITLWHGVKNTASAFELINCLMITEPLWFTQCFSVSYC